MTPSEIEPATFKFVAQYLNHCATISGPQLSPVYFDKSHFETCLFPNKMSLHYTSKMSLHYTSKMSLHYTSKSLVTICKETFLCVLFFKVYLNQTLILYLISPIALSRSKTVILLNQSTYMPVRKQPAKAMFH
jgi:hypothetical protein